MLQTPVYLDNHATTRVDPRVLEAMLPYFGEKFGNAGSTSHIFGRQCHEAVEQSRRTIAQAIHAEPGELVFTSGATESNNLAIRGLADRSRRKGNHILSVPTEHKAVLDPLARLARHGFHVTWLPVALHHSPRAGQLDVGQVADAISDQTMLVSVMLANNEIGVLQPVADIGALCRERDVILHSDATQAVGRIDVDVRALQVDLLSFSAHKMYGPKGVGVLYVRRSNGAVRLSSQVDGGGQERGLRSGTLNVPGIVGLARAIELCLEEREAEQRRLTLLRHQLWTRLTQFVPDLVLNGPPLTDPQLRLAGNLNCRFPAVDGEAVMINAPDVAVSSGSACTSANPQPSHVLLALGLSPDEVRSSLRFGLGRFNTPEEIEFAAESIGAAVQRLRRLGSVFQ
ncbi:MAG: cysteine desulfurase family protein [Pirellulaceae bacterium]